MTTATTFSRVCIEKLKEVSPDAYQECERLTTPKVTNWETIKDIVSYCAENGYPVNNENIPLIICVIYFLVAEYKLYSKSIKMPIGLRSVISDALKLPSPELVSHYSEVSRVLAKGKNWILKFEALANGYINQLEHEN